MKIAVFGHKGWIASYILPYFLKEGIEVIYDEHLRADDPVGVEEFIQKEKPTHLLSLLGRTHGPGFPNIDYLEQPGKLYENLRDNLYAPLLLSQMARTYNCHYTYLGTGCIYNMDNPPDYSFTENDLPNFTGSAYSVVKGFTDLLMRNEPNTLCLRIRLPVTDTHHPRNFITKLVKFQKICSVPNSLSVLPTLVPYMIDMMKKKIIGVINFTNPGYISHEEIMELYKLYVDSGTTWEVTTVDSLSKVQAARRCNNTLDTTELQSLYPMVLSVKDAVIKAICTMGKLEEMA
jgi:3,5-epimerase/4-reductase